MASVCFYFQVHQPFRLRRYSVDAHDPFYFDNDANRVILTKVANKCYRPATRMLLDLVRRHEGRFRISFSITSTALDQMQAWAPDVIDLFQQLVETGACEILGETSQHSLAFLFSRREFDAQVAEHEAHVKALFGTRPAIFRNTELTYHNELAWHLEQRGQYRGVICEGVDRLLGFRSPNYLYRPPAPPGGPGLHPVRLLLKNYRMSDDIAFRFSDRGWPGWPLDAATFAGWVDAINGDGFVCNLFMDYETLGEHQWAESGIFEFLNVLPDHIFATSAGANDFVTPSEAVKRVEPVGVYDVPEVISWADTERDLTAWLGNGMQEAAAQALYRLEDAIHERHARGEEHILSDWRRLTTSDHLYYMCTKYWADGDVHKYFSPYESPYDAYINFMNVVDDLRRRVGEREATVVPVA